jgi:molybdopterin biosynthesis enzyme
MSRGPCTFKQSDMVRAIKAAVAAGVEIARVEVDKEGKIVIIAGKPESKSAGNELDQWRANHARDAQGR